MIVYFTIFILCGVMVVQAVIYCRERMKLYEILKIEKEKLMYGGRDEPGRGRKDKRNKSAHRRALAKWRNGGDIE